MECHAGTLQGIQFAQGGFVGQSHHHAMFLGIAHHSGKTAETQHTAAVHAEEAHRATVLKVVFGFLVLAPRNLHHQAVERVIVMSPHAHGEPGIASLHASFHARCLHLTTVGGFLVFVFQAKQFALTKQ